MSSRLRLSVLVFAAGFVAFFLLRAGALYFQPDLARGLALRNASSSVSWNFASDIKNYASFQRKGIAGTFSTGGGASAQSGVAPAGFVDQKYQKVANIGLRSNDFTQDEKRIRGLIGEHDALIQFEQLKGLEGRRTLRLAVGVAPEAFDAFVEQAQTFGKLTHLTIDKSDKTNEYRDLQAQRRALEKTREALTGLKTRDGEMPALIELEQQILALEQKIQGLGVSLGEFDSENEFVTVKLLLAETTAVQAAARSLLEIAAQSLLWTLLYYPLFWFGLAMCALAVFIGLQVVRIFGRLLHELDAGGRTRTGDADGRTDPGS